MRALNIDHEAAIANTIKSLRIGDVRMTLVTISAYFELGNAFSHINIEPGTKFVIYDYLPNAHFQIMLSDGRAVSTSGWYIARDSEPL